MGSEGGSRTREVEILVTTRIALWCVMLCVIAGYAALGSEEILYQEDFNGITSWELGGSEKYWSAIEDGSYIVELTEGGSLISFCQCGPFEIFRMEVKVVQTRGSSDAHCLIALQAQDIYGQGMLVIDIGLLTTRILRYQDGRYDELVSSTMGSDFDTTRSVEITVDYSEVHILVDGEIVGRWSEPTIMSGDIGLGCASSDADGARFSFNDVRVTSIGDASTVEDAAAVDQEEGFRSQFRVDSAGTGDFASLEQALIEAPDGATVTLSAGEYVLEESLSRWLSITIQGAGADQTRITSSSAGDAIVLGGSESDIAIVGCSFERTSESPGDVVVCRSRSVRMVDCRFSGGITDTLGASCLGAGLHVGRDCYAEVVRCVSERNDIGFVVLGEEGSFIDDCIAQNNRLSGITWDAQGEIRASQVVENERQGITVFGAGASLLENECSRNGSEGIVFTSGSSGMANNNICEDNKAGISIETRGVTVIQNHLIGNEYGIYTTAAGDSTAQENTCEGNLVGILAGGTSSLQIIANLARDNTTAGVMILDSSAAYVGDNTCTNNTIGIFCGEQSKPRLADNICTRNDLDGIYIDGSAAPDILNNVCSSNEGAGISVRNQSSPVVSGNHCEENNGFGILCVEESAAEVSENICSENLQMGIAVFDAATPSITENQCFRNGVAGIAARGGSRPSVLNNLCDNNGQFGILCAEQSRATVEGNTCTGNELSGIGYFDTAGGVARRNTCTDNEVGIFVTPEAQVMLQSNVCSGNKSAGIYDTR